MLAGLGAIVMACWDVCVPGNSGSVQFGRYAAGRWHPPRMGQFLQFSKGGNTWQLQKETASGS